MSDPHPVDAYVGQRLRMRRTILGMSQNKLGQLLGLTFQQVQKYERGANRVSSSRLYELAHILSVPLGYFFEGYDPENDAAEGFAEGQSKFENDMMQSKETADLLRYYYTIEAKEKRKKVLELIRAAADL